MNRRHYTSICRQYSQFFGQQKETPKHGTLIALVVFIVLSIAVSILGGIEHE